VILGLTIAQFLAVLKQNPINHGSLVWLAGGIVSTALLLGIALGLELPYMRNFFKRG
jgi:hypothetical protein